MAGLEVTADDVEKEEAKETSEDNAKGIKDDFNGAGIVSDAANLYADASSGNWAEGLLDTAGVVGSIGDFVEDPLAGLLSAGFGWAMEHVSFLKEPLDWLTGDQNAIKAASQTWGNVAKELDGAGKQLSDAVQKDTAPWKGPAIDAYKPVATGHAMMIGGASTAAQAASTVVSMCGTVLDAVRSVVRDLISKAVGDLVACLLEWAAAEVLSLGLATPGMIGDVVRRAVQWANRIMTWVKKITSVFKKAKTLLDKLEEIQKKLHEVLQKTKVGSKVSTAIKPFKEGAEAGMTRMVRHTYAKEGIDETTGAAKWVHSGRPKWPDVDTDALGKETVNDLAKETRKKFQEKGAEAVDENILHDKEDKG